MANKEKRKASKNKWKDSNPEYDKEYYKSNPEKIKSIRSKYYYANREKINARKAKYRAYQKEMREMQEDAGFELSYLKNDEQC